MGILKGVFQRTMKVLNKELVTKFAKLHPDCTKAINSLILEIEQSSWNSPHAIKSRYPTASIIGNKNVVFNICGNKYRIWLKISYKSNVATIKKIGTHQEYDNWEIK